MILFIIFINAQIIGFLIVYINVIISNHVSRNDIFNCVSVTILLYFVAADKILLGQIFIYCMISYLLDIKIVEESQEDQETRTIVSIQIIYSP